MKKAAFIATMLLSTNVLSAEILTLEDGRKVQLNDDFTWQYLNDSKESPATESIQAVPVITSETAGIKNGTQVTPGSGKNTLQLSDSGIDLLLAAATYQSGELTIPTAVTNQSTQDIISVEMKLTVHDADGKLLYEDTQPVWKSIKRMADTYLRSKTSKPGRDIKLSLPELDSYVINAEITQVESR